MTESSRNAAGDEGSTEPPAAREFIPEDRPSELGPPPRTPVPSEQQPATAAPGFAPRSPASEPVPDIEGLNFGARRTEQNSRAVIGMVLSGLALAGVLIWFVGVSTPLLITVALAIGGIVMGAMGRASARRGVATNRGLALAAIIVGCLAILATVAVYALLLIALSAWV
ncbi:DUF4190 domain-containing protein [uncultured Demequina sp.]|uniref:DUF4190 domain-containing protein n=1 Tax=uncultured Demequina sp. TaxID=693499 RepID=UPI0025D45AE0|nr:hypothetical protein [uncultured Demequina sp.]